MSWPCNCGTPAESGPAAPSMGDAQNFVLLAGNDVQSIGSTMVVGNVGAGSTAVEGFAPEGDGLIGGGGIVDATAGLAALPAIYAALDQTPTEDLSGQDLGGLALGEGVYDFTGDANFASGTLTLNGPSDAIYIFKVAGNLVIGDGTTVNTVETTNQACRTFWRVGGTVTVGAGATVGGTILAQGAVILGNSVQLGGRAISVIGNVQIDTLMGSAAACYS